MYAYKIIICLDVHVFECKLFMNLCIRLCVAPVQQFVARLTIKYGYAQVPIHTLNPLKSKIIEGLLVLILV